MLIWYKKMSDLSLNELKQIASIKNYKPIKTKSNPNSSYIEYESKRDTKTKIYHLKNILI